MNQFHHLSNSKLRELSNSELHEQTLAKVQEERDVTLEVLVFLRETERRRSFAGLSSLHKYCVRELKYSDSAAQRRIDSMRLLKELPEMEAGLKEGRLNLSVVSIAQTFFR